MSFRRLKTLARPIVKRRPSSNLGPFSSPLPTLPNMRPPPYDSRYDTPYYDHYTGWQPRQGDDRPFRNPEEYEQWTRSGQPPPPLQPTLNYSYQDWSRSQPYDRHYSHAGPSSNYGRGDVLEAEREPFGYRQSQRRDYHNVSPRPDFPQPRSAPAGGGYLPPHLRNRSPGATGPSSQPSKSSSSRVLQISATPISPRRPKAPFVPFLPPKSYLELSKPSRGTSAPKAADKGVPKLLVLDLNGALIYRTERSSTSRKSYPRPYLGNFLEYLFTSSNSSSAKKNAEGGRRPWEVFVWSSAQPHNVRAMVELGFGQKWIEGVYEPEQVANHKRRVGLGEGRLLGVWARDKMGLNERDYGNKVQTFKDLRKVIDHLAKPIDGEIGDVPPPPPIQFDERTTVLLDDSPLKAIYQPWNQLVIPEYDKPEFNASKIAVQRILRDIEAETEGLDEILLAVIGILNRLETVENVPAWVRAGGLIQGPLEEELESGIRQMSVDRDDPSPEPTVESLPSHESFVHWYSIPEVLAYWVKAGKDVLKQRGITVDHGLNENGASSDQPNGFSPAPRDRGDSRPTNRQRAWTPSAPQSPLHRSPRRSPSPYGQRRDYTTQTLPDPSTSASVGQSTTLQPRIPKGVKTDSWRTFRAYDVGLYLQDFADRVTHSCPLDEQSRHLLRSTGDLLRQIGPDPVYEHSQDKWGNLCVECTLKKGDSYSKKINGEKVRNMQRATANMNANGGAKGKAKAVKRNNRPKKAKAKKGKRGVMAQAQIKAESSNLPPNRRTTPRVTTRSAAARQAAGGDVKVEYS